MSFSLGPWAAAPIDTAGETVFAVGDVHGCREQLETMLDGIAALATGAATPRLVFLGDLVDRGPDSIGCLRRWAEAEPVHGIARVDRLMGNHEQLMLLAGDPELREAWLSMSGDTMLAELRAAASQPEAPPGRALLRAALGEAVLARLDGLASHRPVGNLVLVHAGLDPAQPLAEFLALPWDTLATRPKHWAWMRKGFLDWAGGFGGRIVVHGHTPPAKQHAFTGLEDPHVLHQSRLNLDGGSAVTGIVAAAQLETGRYRVLRAIG